MVNGFMWTMFYNKRGKCSNFKVQFIRKQMTKRNKHKAVLQGTSACYSSGD